MQLGGFCKCFRGSGGHSKVAPDFADDFAAICPPQPPGHSWQPPVPTEPPDALSRAGLVGSIVDGSRECSTTSSPAPLPDERFSNEPLLGGSGDESPSAQAAAEVAAGPTAGAGGEVGDLVAPPSSPRLLTAPALVAPLAVPPVVPAALQTGTAGSDAAAAKIFKPAEGNFLVELHRASPAVRWGFVWNSQVMDKQQERVVEKVFPSSPAADWNASKPALSVRPGDRLVRVNGEGGCLETMTMELCRHVIACEFQPDEPRPTTGPTTLKAGSSVAAEPLLADLQPGCYGVDLKRASLVEKWGFTWDAEALEKRNLRIVDRIAPGSFADLWCKQRPDCPLRRGDELVKVNGRGERLETMTVELGRSLRILCEFRSVGPSCTAVQLSPAAKALKVSRAAVATPPLQISPSAASKGPVGRVNSSAVQTAVAQALGPASSTPGGASRGAGGGGGGAAQSIRAPEPLLYGRAAALAASAAARGGSQQPPAAAQPGVPAALAAATLATAAELATSPRAVGGSPAAEQASAQASPRQPGPLPVPALPPTPMQDTCGAEAGSEDEALPVLKIAGAPAAARLRPQTARPQAAAAAPPTPTPPAAPPQQAPRSEAPVASATSSPPAPDSCFAAALASAPSVAPTAASPTAPAAAAHAAAPVSPLAAAEPAADELPPSAVPRPRPGRGGLPPLEATRKEVPRLLAPIALGK